MSHPAPKAPAEAEPDALRGKPATLNGEPASHPISNGQPTSHPVPPAVVSALPAALTALVIAATLSGAVRAGQIIDPGALVRWGLPVSTVVSRLAASLTIGSFALAAFALTPRGPATQEALGRAWGRALFAGRVGAILWPLAEVAHLVFGYAASWGTTLDTPSFGGELWKFATQIGLGQAYLASVIMTVLVSVLAIATAGLTLAAWTSFVGVLALVPVALTGHAAGAVAHNLAVSSVLLHLAPVALWVGGLIALVIVERPLRASAELVKVASRYSAIALWCFILVAISGVFATLIRVTSPADLVTTNWGRLLTVKLILFAAVGYLGWLHRRKTIPRMEETPSLFVRLAAVEVALLSAMMGIAVALGSTAPPVPQEPELDPSAVFQLTSYPEPPPPSLANWFTQWHPDPLYLVGAASAVLVYLYWVRRLKKRGDSWPISRTLSWVFGWAMFTWVVGGGPYVYGLVLFSAHMVMHMLLVMLMPIFFAFSGPITLLSRAVPPRRDGSRGPREWALALVHSKWARAWSLPVVAAINFAGSLYIFYYTGLVNLAMTSHVGHVLMVVHFSLAGYLFASVLVGIDPGIRRPAYPIRLVLLFATMVFHAFFGLSLAENTELLAADYYGRLGLSWWVNALTDQHIGGYITWGIGELPMLILALILAVSWSKEDDKAAKRIDRNLDRTNDAELEAYNQMLAERAGRMSRSPRATGGAET